MPGDRLFDPSSSLKIRDPQDNASPNDQIRNPPRYMEYGGLESGRARGFMLNGFKIHKPGQTQSNVPFDKKRTNKGR
jgi:hypothetical protein